MTETEKSVEEILKPFLEGDPPWYWYNGIVMTAARDGDERIQLLTGREERLYWALEGNFGWLFEILDFSDSQLKAGWKDPTIEPEDDSLSEIQSQLEEAQWRAVEYRRITDYIWAELRKFSKFEDFDTLRVIHGSGGKYFLTTAAYANELDSEGVAAMRDAPRPAA